MRRLATAAKPFYADPLFYGLTAPGLVGLALPFSGSPPPWYWIALLALAEEIVFRMGLQEALNRLFGRRALGPLGLGNLAASVVFAAAHLLYHPPLWAAGVLAPSLVFGLLWDRYGSVLPSWLTHAFYNFCYFGLAF